MVISLSRLDYHSNICVIKLSAFFLVVPGDVSFMGRETKSLDVMTDKSSTVNDEPIPPHDLSMDTHDQSTVTYESSTITHEGSTSTHEESTITHEDSTLNEQSTSYEHSITSQELGNSEIQQADKAVNSFQSTPKQILEVEAENKESIQINSQKQGTVVFTFQDDQNDEPHPRISDDTPNTSDVVLETFVDSTTTDVPNNSTVLTSADVPDISVTAPLSDHVLINHNEQVHGSSEIVNTNVDDTEIACKRQSSTDSEPSVLDSKI